MTHEQVEVICSHRLKGEVERLAGTAAGTRRPGHAIVEVSSSALANLKGAFEIGRILDRYWVVTDPRPDCNEAMVASFFDDLSSGYEGMVDGERNRRNVEHLLWLLLDHCRVPDGPLLDLGCGPGASRTQVTARGREVWGLDISPRMREVAAAAGMDVLAPEELGRSGAGRFAGAFASYVLHLDPRPADLARVMSLMAPSGVLVANVHKERGLEALREHVEAEGCSWTLLPSPRLDIHGPYVAISDDR